MFTFEMQENWFPGCGWLRYPHARDTWEQAMEEAQHYARFAWEYRKIVVSIRVIKLEECV